MTSFNANEPSTNSQYTSSRTLFRNTNPYILQINNNDFLLHDMWQVEICKSHVLLVFQMLNKHGENTRCVGNLQEEKNNRKEKQPREFFLKEKTNLQANDK